MTCTQSQPRSKILCFASPWHIIIGCVKAGRFRWLSAAFVADKLGERGMFSNSASPFLDPAHLKQNDSTNLCRGFTSLKRALGLPFLILALGLMIFFGSTAEVRSHEAPQNPAKKVNKPPKKKAEKAPGGNVGQDQNGIAKQNRDRRLDQLIRKLEALIQEFLMFEAEARAKRPPRSIDDGDNDDDGDNNEDDGDDRDQDDGDQDDEDNDDDDEDDD